jgi:photosystem II stability/assembly factor-like uncharacterized protein
MRRALRFATALVAVVVAVAALGVGGRRAVRLVRRVRSGEREAPRWFPSILTAEGANPTDWSSYPASSPGEVGLLGERWAPRGIGGGGALFVPEISPFDDQLYMATDMRGVFHSRNFGRSWLTYDFRTIRGGNQSQVRFTSDPQRLYAIGEKPPANATLLTSTDGGTTFAVVPGVMDEPPLYLEVDPKSTERFLVADYHVIHFSSNGGKTPRAVYTAADNGAGVVVGGAFWDGRDIYVGTNDGLLVSHDGGASFAIERYVGIPPNEAVVSFAGATVGSKRRFFVVTTPRADLWAGIDTCAVAGSSNQVYRLGTGESSWMRVAQDVHAAFVRMTDVDLDVAYLAGSNRETKTPQVQKTSDGGTTWVDVLRTNSNANIATGWSGADGDEPWTFGECPEGFAVSRSDPKRALLTDMGFVHGTTDGGATWQALSVDPADRNPAGKPTPRGKPYRTSGVEQTSVWWLEWADDRTLFASLTDITSLRSTSGGLAWSRESGNGLRDNTTYQTVADRNGVLYAATSSVHDMYMSYRLVDSQLDTGRGSVKRSSNKGVRWTPVHAFGHPVVSLALDPQSADGMYAAVENSHEGGVYHTADLSRGDSSTWTRLAAPPRTEGHPYMIRVLRDGTLVVTYSGRRDAKGAFTESAGVFVSSDHGATWDDRSDPNMRYWVKDVVIDPNDPTESTWYVGVFEPFGQGLPPIRNGLYRTTDRGKHWTQLFGGHDVESCSVDPRDPHRMFVTTESDGLFETSTLGAPTPHFEADQDYPFAHPMRVFFNPKDPAETWVASFGGGMRFRRF